jgi:hypothetical protein
MGALVLGTSLAPVPGMTSLGLSMSPGGVFGVY